MSPWRKTFACAFAAQTLAMVGFCFALPFLAFFIKELGVTDVESQTWWAGVVMSTSGLTLALFAPLWGLLADRFGRKAMVMRSMFGGTIVLALMSYVQTIGQLVVCRLLQGAFTGTIAASIALVASVSPPHRSGFALGMMQTAVFLGAAIGPLIGGVVADHLGYRAAFRVGALVVFLAGLLVWRGTREDFVPSDPEHTARRLSYGQIILGPGFLAAVFVLFSIRLSNTLTNPSFPLIVEEILDSTTRLNSVTGAIICCAALSGAVSAAVLGYFGDSFGHKRVLLACSLLASVVSVAHVYAHTVLFLTVARMLFGLTVAGMIPSANALIRRMTHDSNIGKAYGVATSMSMAGLAIGPFLGGCLGRAMGLRAPFVATGIGQLVVVVVVLVFVRGSVTSRRATRPTPS